MKHIKITWPNDNLTRDGIHHESPIWGWFGMTYAAYLTVPRLLLCGMPLEWQEKFVKLMEEADDYCKDHGIQYTPSYLCQRQNTNGRFMKDPWADYRHGDIIECAKFDRELEDRERL